MRVIREGWRTQTKSGYEKKKDAQVPKLPGEKIGF